jgi:OFA family oxalate/formate antiporter-like MFS transporter
MTDSFEAAKKRRWGYAVLGVVLLLFLGLIYAWSVFRVPLEQEFGWAKSETSITFSISMMMFCLGGLASGIITVKRGARFTLTCCAVFLAIGFIAASRIDSLLGIYITYGGFCGFGVGLGYNAAISTVLKWFPDKQGLVSGIALMGFGFGGMILGTLGAGMITAVGWRTTFFVFGIVFAVIMFVGAIFLRPAHADFLAQLSTQGNKKSFCVEEANYRLMLHRKNFWLYFFWAIILSAAGLAIINISTAYAGTFLGDNLTQAAAIAGIVSIANGVGRVLFGGVFDAKGYKFTMFAVCLTFIAAGGMLLLAETTKNIYILGAAFLVIGLAYAGVVPTNSAYTAFFFGQKNYSLNFSITNLNLIFASYLGPWCANGSYTMTFMIIIVFAIIGMAITFAIRRPALTKAEGNYLGTEKGNCRGNI